MLTLRVLPRNINQFIKQSSQQFHLSVKLLTQKDPSSSSSSSSSDSSDSDSDRENNKVKKPKNEQTTVDSEEILSTSARLDALLNQMSTKKKQSEKSKKAINVAIKPKAERFTKESSQVKEEKEPLEELKSAAQEVAKTLPGDAKENELQLLSQLLDLKPSSSVTQDLTDEQTASATSADLSSVISRMKIAEAHDKMINYQTRRQNMVKKIQERFQEPSISKSLLHAKTVKKQMQTPNYQPELNVVHKPLGIFSNVFKDHESDILTLETWESMEKREIKLALLTSPQNIFEELIQWTEQGKLWHFPINNEQGMEEEEKVHFSEHVFMDRHLKGWCPKRGPIRHFMELVCTGLSKNPYMTVEEKVGHITWYKNFFEDKKALLDELGVLDNIKVTDEKKKEIEA